MAALLDTGFLLAVIAANDPQHQKCVQILRQEPQVLMPDVVLPELAYLMLRDMDHPTLARFLRSIAEGKPKTIVTTSADLTRAAELLEQYADARVDFVDRVITAIAERLDITRILTLDRRHFSIFRPKHSPAFQVLP